MLCFLFIFFTTALGMNTAYAAVTIPYSENFEDGIANNFTVDSGTWTITTDVTKVYKTNSTDSLSRTTVGETTWSNYTVQSDIKVNTWGSTAFRTAAIIARYTDASNYYLLGYDLGSSGLVIKKKVAGTQTILATKAFTFNTGQSYTLKATVIGSNLTLYVNGVRQLTVTDSTFTAGKSGLISCYGDSRFDNYSVNTPEFPLTQANVNTAVAEGLLWYKEGLEWDWHSKRSGNSLWYLVIASTYNPDFTSSSGVKVKDRALAQFRNVIIGGNEPGCSGGGLNAQGYGVLIDSIAIAKSVPAIWDALTATEKDKLLTITKACLVGSHWLMDDDNNFSTGIDQRGNANKSWNPNHKEGALGAGIAAMYALDGATAANSFLTSFDTATFLTKINSYGFSNINFVFTQTPAATLNSATRNTFTYSTYTLSQPFYWVKTLSDDMYNKNVASSGAGGLGHLLAGQSGLPNLGVLGMAQEFDSVDAGGGRSSLGYVWQGWGNSIPNRHIVEYFGDWGTGVDQTSVENKYNIGSTDMIYKAQNGYHDYAKGANQGDTTVSSLNTSGLFDLVKEVWLNILK